MATKLNIFNANADIIMALKAINKTKSETDSNESFLKFIVFTKLVKIEKNVVSFFLPQLITKMVVLQNKILEDYITTECSKHQIFLLKTLCYLNSICYCFTGKPKKFINALLIKLKAENEAKKSKSLKNPLRIEKAIAEKQNQRDKIKVEKIQILTINSDDENEPFDLTQDKKFDKIHTAYDIFNYIHKISAITRNSDITQRDNLLKSLLNKLNELSFEHSPIEFGFLEEGTKFVQISALHSAFLSKNSSIFLLFFEILHDSDTTRSSFYKPQNDRFSADLKSRGLQNVREHFSCAYGSLKAEIRSSSLFGRKQKWDILPLIYKNDMHIRQELLAMQIIAVLDDIWKNARIPLQITLYDVFVVSENGGFIRAMPNSLSLDKLKKNHPGLSLNDIFLAKFGPENSAFLAEARRKFVESMAAYSLVTYFLQVKDRHNANILLDQEGRVVHIDFGYFLSNSPGNVNFESVPFKLTSEHISIMCTSDDESLYDLFKMLFIRGFSEARKHWDTIAMLVEMMRTEESPMSCFRDPNAVEKLIDRFCIMKTDEECVEYACQLIDESRDNWRTEQYDSYQRITNGIL